MFELLERPETTAAAAPLVIIATTPPPLPTFVPQSVPAPQLMQLPRVPRFQGSTGGGGPGGPAGGSDAGASGGGILPGSALTVRIYYKCLGVIIINTNFDI